jgi:hypothetical protein
VVAVTVNARRSDELGEGLEELKGREQWLGTAVDVGSWEAVERRLSRDARAGPESRA